MGNDDVDVFVDDYQIEAAGHVGTFRSDKHRVSFVECSCGMKASAPGARRVYDLWSAHYG